MATYDKDPILESIGRKIGMSLFPNMCSRNITVFLCGKGPNDRTSLRTEIGTALTLGGSSSEYDVVYPEHIFDELLSEDLLDLENQLAKSVDVVVLILESPGAIAELGAFANHTELAGKLLCVQDQKYRRSKGFIARGPLRHLIRQGPDHVVFADWKDVAGVVPRLRKHISALKKKSQTKEITPDNVIHSRHFVLPCIFLFEPVHMSTLIRLVELAARVDEVSARNATVAAVTSLTKDWLISRVSHNEASSISLGRTSLHRGPLHVYGLTRQGVERFERAHWKRWNLAPFQFRGLDELRLEILAWQRRHPSVVF
jgi:hypothetical protein